jgi:alkylated DNA repair protein alkB family protein 6
MQLTGPPHLSQPHEDGPAYVPLIATVSLGSPQALEIFQYLSESDPSPPLTGSSRHEVFGEPSSASKRVSGPGSAEARETGQREASGRPIATTPMVCIYLEPRSLLIIRKALYETHLHGIDHAKEDVFEIGKGAKSTALSPTAEPADSSIRIHSIPVANAAYLSSALKGQLQEKRYPDDLHVSRGTRVSMTFRQVDKTFQGNLSGRLVKGKATR